MSTPLLSQNRFADVQRSLIHHATDEMQPGSCSMKNSAIARALDVAKPFGEEGKANVECLTRGLVFDLARLNHAAHIARYKDAADTPAPTPINDNTGRLLNPCALLKALHCIRCNCDGGKVTNETLRAALRHLDAVIEGLQDYIIEELPEYKTADWF